MKKLILIALLMLAAKFGFSQYSTITYYHFKSKVTTSSVGDTIVIAKKQPVFTGQYLKTENGIYPIMMSPNRKFYIERVSQKTGRLYKQYL